jgi:hypothetical protein
MTSRQRVLGCFARTGYDRIPIKHEGTPEINHALMKHFGLSNMEQLLHVVGEDFRYVGPDYCGPELRAFPDGSTEGYWGKSNSTTNCTSGRCRPRMGWWTSSTAGKTSAINSAR